MASRNAVPQNSQQTGKRIVPRVALECLLQRDRCESVVGIGQ
jgi:hypothetical protein